MKPLCVLLHGYPNNSQIWKEQLPLLEKKFDILNLSLPGSDDGIVTREDLKLDHLVSVYRDKILERANERVVLMGHDIGAFVLSEVNRELGEKVIARVYMGGMDFRLFSYRLRTSDQKFRSWYVALFQTPVLPEIIVTKIKKLLAFQLYRRTPELEKEAPNGFKTIGIYRELIAGIRRSKKAGGKVKGPTLFLFGEKDDYIGAPSDNDVSRFYDDATIKVLSGGHWFFREDPKSTNTQLETFLSGF